ncbi:hypothetical protein [Serratia phage SMP]|uniref:Uncharacterized protein n=1 Tax=Serratia phage SMP TaxID=2982904 RepID=A0A9E8G0U8_9CAUD|nr:hypothetical protein [Serratia phage SMP]
MQQSKIFYISSGAKNAMYTLRTIIRGNGFEVDNYICNLATDPERAEEKAEVYFDAFVARVGNSSAIKFLYQGYADFQLFERSGALSVLDTERLTEVENGIMPFGKHKGRVIEELPMYTILWWADQASDAHNIKERVFQAVCARCLGVALDKGYIEQRKIDREERAAAEEAAKAASNYIGEVKQRLEFEGVIEASIDLGAKQVAWNTWVENYLNKIMVNGNVVIYFGKCLGEKGDAIKMKATVKEHNERDGMKQTIVNRPSVH